MASTEAQRKWRAKNKEVKTQLNVMARNVTHEGLAEMASIYKLKGKGEAVAFATYVTRELMQRGWRDPHMKIVFDSFVAGFKGRRNIYSA